MGNSRKAKDDLSWTEMLAETRMETAEVPAGWKTASEIAKEMDRSVSTASQQLRVAIDSGRAEVRKFPIKAGDRIYPVPHYRIIK